jgi:hypothetical protein
MPRPGQQSKERECPARSARTRTVRSSRRWPQCGTCGIKIGLAQMRSLFKKLDGSVKHATSPPHPDRSWQVVILRRSQFSPRTNQPIRPSSPIAHPQSYPPRLGPLPLLFPDERAPISLRSEPRPKSRSEKFRHAPPVAHIAMSFGPTIAWKASPTRTPPPICTSAPFLKPRWSQDRGAASGFKKYTMRGFSQSV